MLRIIMKEVLVILLIKKRVKESKVRYFFQHGEGDKDNEDEKLKYGTVNVKDVREALIHMIIVDELPFKHVGKAGFKHFVQVACPRFHIPSRTAIALDVREAKGMSGVGVEENIKGVGGN